MTAQVKSFPAMPDTITAIGICDKISEISNMVAASNIAKLPELLQSSGRAEQ